MADWYVSSVTYNALPQWAATTAYTVGQLIRAVTVPVSGYGLYVHRCTTAGTTAGTEPGWGVTNNATTSSGTAVFTNVSGQSAYGWAAAAGGLSGIMEWNWPRPVPGDRVFVASDHTENGGNTFEMSGTSSALSLPVISVNRAGSVPPVEADHLAGAAFTTPSSDMRFDSHCGVFIQGLTFTATNGQIIFNYNTTRVMYFKDCLFVLAGTNTGYRIQSGNPGRQIFDNCRVQFGHSNQAMSTGGGGWDFTWINTPVPIAGSIFPALLFYNQGYLSALNLKGLDLTSLGTGILTQYNTGGNAGQMKMLLDNCKVSPSTVRYNANVGGPFSDEVELINCHDGTNPINERATSQGNLTTERTITLSGGPADTTGTFAHKMVSNTRVNKLSESLESFWLDVMNTITGVSKTATVEIISSGSLNTDDIVLEVEYRGTAGSPVTTLINTWPKPLTVVAALPTSSATWNSSPGTPVKQYLRVTFTPQVAGRIRGRVRLKKVSTVVYINPQLILA